MDVMRRNQKFDTFYRRMLIICPGATCDEDNDGQVIVYTGMRLDPDAGNDEGGSMIPLEDE